MSNRPVRPVERKDIPSIISIYNDYIKNTFISFEEEPVSVAVMEERIRKITETYPWIVCEEKGKVVGYAYASTWKERAAYRFSGEVTVYVERNSIGNGIGSILYESLLAEIRKMDLHSLMAVIALPNEASVKLHEKFGFRKTAHFKEVGYKFGGWIDVGYWQLLL